MKKALLILSAPEMYGFMRGQPNRLRAMGYTPCVVAAASSILDARAADDTCRRIILPIARDISIGHDAASVARLVDLLRREAPEAVILSGPKAIFLGGIAAWLADVPVRVAVYHGMRQECMRGPMRLFLDTCDRISFALATTVLSVSRSLAKLAVRRALVPDYKIYVTGPGTANGVDLRRFTKSEQLDERAGKLAQSLGIRSESPVLGFVGRITEDKGVVDLWYAYQVIRRDHPGVRLLLIGPVEATTDRLRVVLTEMRADPNVILTGPVEDVESYMSLLDCLVLPSFREGFGMVIVEAAALGVPSVAYAATGVIDAIVDGETGWCVPVGDKDALAARVGMYLTNSDLRCLHGRQAHDRVRRELLPDKVWAAYAGALTD